MFLKKINIPNTHIRVNAKNLEDYEKKTHDFISTIKKDFKYNYIEFRSDEKNVDQKLDNGLIVNNDNKFLNLKDYYSIYSLITIFVKNNKQYSFNPEFSHFLVNLLKSIYPSILLKISTLNSISINDILSLIQNHRSLNAKYDTYLTKDYSEDEILDAYDENICFFNLDKILNDMKLTDFNITHADIKYENLSLIKQPIHFTNVDYFYKEVIFLAIALRVIYTRSVASLYKTKKYELVQVDLASRKELFIILNDHIGAELPSTSHYAQLRAVGIRLIYPNLKNTCCTNKEYLANTIIADL